MSDQYSPTFKKVISNVSGTDIVMFEFGVGQAYSTIHLLEAFKEKSITPKVFLFDSFQGLPVEESGVPYQFNWASGAFCWDFDFVKEKLQNYLDYITFISGWYENSLNTESINKYNIEPADFIHIDCDLYISSKQIINFIFDNDLVKSNAVIRYDDWRMMHIECGKGGESKAHFEAIDKYSLIMERIPVDDDWYTGSATFRYKGRNNAN